MVESLREITTGAFSGDIGLALTSDTTDFVSSTHALCRQTKDTGFSNVLIRTSGWERIMTALFLRVIGRFKIDLYCVNSPC